MFIYAHFLPLSAMKTKLSVSIEEETASRLDRVVREHGFRNRSHLIEHALDRYLQEGKR